MSGEDLERRISQLEDSQESLDSSINNLTTTIALLNQTVEAMAKREEQKQQFADRVILFGVGGLLSAVVAWIVRGGLGA